MVFCEPQACQVPCGAMAPSSGDFGHFPILETDSTWPLPLGRVFVFLHVVVHHEDVQVNRCEHTHRDLDTETRALLSK